MYPATQEAIAAQVAYRQDRLAHDFRRTSVGAPRRWLRLRATGRNRLS
jgi:hypothetical protein